MISMQRGTPWICDDDNWFELMHWLFFFQKNRFAICRFHMSCTALHMHTFSCFSINAQLIMRNYCQYIFHFLKSLFMLVSYNVHPWGLGKGMCVQFLDQVSFSDHLPSDCLTLSKWKCINHSLRIFSRTSWPISTKLGRKYPWTQSIQICLNEWLHSFLNRDDRN